MTARNIEWLVRAWKDAGVCNGDVLLLHASVKRTLSHNNSIAEGLRPEDILESFLDALGPNGTLVLPLFNFDFTNGVPFDIKSTPSHMGILTEVARKRNDMVRTGHPVYSFGVLGRHSSIFEGVDNKSAYGHDSPFSILRDLDGKIGALDLDENDSMTFHHFVEESCQVGYRYYKTFTGSYTDFQGSTSIREYLIYVRDLSLGIETYANPAGEKLWQAGLYSGCRPHIGSGLRTISARKMYAFMESVIRAGGAEGTLYRVAKL